MSALSSLKKHGLPMALYAFGSAALFFADILVTTSVSDREAGEWGTFRSIIAIGSVVCLIGLDQVFVRRPGHSKAIMARLVVQIPVMVALCVGAAAYLDIGISLFAIAIVLLSAATSLGLFGFFRSHRLLTQAQLAHHGWKLIAFTVLVLLTMLGGQISISTIMILATVGAAIIVLAMLWRQRGVIATTSREVERGDDLFRIGKRFFLSSQLLAIASWGEQLLMTQLGGLESAGRYFGTMAVFIFPIAILTGYLAFLLGPFLRDQHERFLGLLRRRWLMGVVVVVAVVVVAHFAGRTAWSILKPDTALMTGVAICFSVGAALRTFYIVPSAYIGVHATTRTHEIFIALQVVALAIACLLFIVLRGADLSLPLSVAIASTTNWAMRFGAASFCMWRTSPAAG